MEGKAVLFKKFAGINAVPLCLGHVFKEDGKTDPEKVITAVRTLEPTFGGINLEDIGAPACFAIEPALKQAMSIPVFHDDQHGTAIISLSGILNALKVVGKKIEDCKFVMNGAGAAGIACAEYYVSAGANRDNFTICDSKGVIHAGRTDLNEQKKRFAHVTEDRTLTDAIRGADVFIGVSVAGALTGDMVKTMAKDAIVLAMANPTPEIYSDEALAAGAAVACTGRSDFCNQVNNVLGFPGIFRGAWDVRARNVNEDMKLAAAEALCEVASMEVDPETMEELKTAYPADAANGMFDGKNPLKLSYVIPKPFDPRVVPHVARKVAEAAMKTNMAKVTIEDLDAYEKSVRERIKKSR
jgi:malate dehydrogenase (oxaloacetate-decarboxylating)(NADP+)